jgi:aminobenzoyl-glutamate utilization protein B
MPPAKSAKPTAEAFIARNEAALARLGDTIFYYGELGMQEHRTAALLTKILAGAGFAVERELSGFPTGFLARFGRGEPVIALHCEYDGNPDNSQVPGVAERREIVPGAPGHCEGHNVNAAVTITAALAIARAMQAHDLAGTLKVFGAPAEEQLISRPYFVRDGHFDDVGAAFHTHILDAFRTDYGLAQLGMMSVQFTFGGMAAHAAMSPWEGRDALDAAVLMDVGMAQFREHMRPGMSAHRVFTEGGVQPNVIPGRATCWWFFRDRSPEGIRALFEQGERIARGAAMMANCELATNVMSGVWPVRCNETLARVIQPNIEAAGMPAWTAEEHDFARAVQRAAGQPAGGLREAVTPLTGPCETMAASNDCGDVSWVVPMGRIWFPGNIPGAPFHHWAAGAALTTSIAHKGAGAGARALAGSVLDLLTDPDLVAQARRTFQAEIAGTTYRSLLPDGQTPPLELNRALMERYRPLMEPHYLPGDVAFA